MRIAIATLILGILVVMTSCVINTETTGRLDKITINKIQNVVKGYKSSKPTCSLLKKGELSWLESLNNKGHSVVSNMGENDFVLDIYFKANNAKSRVNPLEVYAIFNCYMELQKQQLEYNIVALVCTYSRGMGIDDASTWLIVITYDEFEILYNNTYAGGKKINELAKELGDMWINKHHYNRFGLTFQDSDKFRELLITPWKNNQPSVSADLSVGYFYGVNKLFVDKTNHYNNISSTQTIWSTSINETGFLYGAWDEQNNIWLYGEDIGIRLYKSGGGENWEPSDFTADNEIPYALKKVLETRR